MVKTPPSQSPPATIGASTAGGTDLLHQTDDSSRATAVLLPFSVSLSRRVSLYLFSLCSPISVALGLELPAAIYHRKGGGSFSRDSSNNEAAALYLLLSVSLHLNVSKFLLVSFPPFLSLVPSLFLSRFLHTRFLCFDFVSCFSRSVDST